MRCALAPGLCNAAVSVTNAQDALEGWRDTVRDHLAHDPTRQIGRHHPKLAASVTGAFPEEGVVASYIHPAVSACTALPAVQEPQAPDVATLGALVQQQLGWDDPQRLLDTFSQHVWPAVVMQEILRDLNVTTVVPPTPRRLLSTAPHSCTKRVVNGVKGVNVQVPTLALSVDTLSSHSSVQKASEDGTRAHHNLNVWIPQPVYGAWTALTNCSRSSSLSPSSARVPAEVRVCAVL